MAKKDEKAPNFKIDEPTKAVEWTVPSTSFKLTISKGGGSVAIQHRETQNTTFTVARDKLDELISVLTKVRDEYGPACDQYGEEK